MKGYKVQIINGGKILEVGEDPGDQGCAWKKMLGTPQGPGHYQLSRTLRAGHLHSTNRYHFLSHLSRPAAISLLGREAETF